MSTNPGEPNPQEWPTYPGLPQDQGRSPGPRPRREPDPSGTDPYAAPESYAEQAYQPYPQPPAGLPHQQMQPHQAPYQQQSQNSTWLQNKWTWIIVGVIGVFFITGMASGEFRIAPLIFALVIWQILRHRRKT